MPLRLNATQAQIRVLANKHVARYSKYIDHARAGHPGYSYEDSLHYLGIWVGILAKDCDPARLAPFERREVVEAMDDEVGDLEAELNRPWEPHPTEPLPPTVVGIIVQLPPKLPDVSVSTEDVIAILQRAMTEPVRMLIVERKEAPGKWALPGGKVEPGETLLQALTREVKEETGVVVEVADEFFRGTSSRSGRPVIAFNVTRWSGTPETREQGVNVRWGTLEDLLDSPFADFYKAMWWLP